MHWCGVCRKPGASFFPAYEKLERESYNKEHKLVSCIKWGLLANALPRLDNIKCQVAQWRVRFVLIYRLGCLIVCSVWENQQFYTANFLTSNLCSGNPKPLHWFITSVADRKLTMTFMCTTVCATKSPIKINVIWTVCISYTRILKTSCLCRSSFYCEMSTNDL